jgi:hypothetical protein
MDIHPTRATRGRARRGLILPAALAAALAAALLSAAPARAGGQCNLHYIFNYDGSPVWSNMAVGSGPSTSCTLAPAIARYSGGTTIAATSGDDTVFHTYVNPDGWPAFSVNYTYGIAGLLPDLGPPAMTSSGAGTAVAFSIAGGGVYFSEPGQIDSLPAVYSGDLSLSGAPAIARTGWSTEIAATGADDSLWFFWNLDGTPYWDWSSDQLAGPSQAYFAPAIAADYTYTRVAYIAPDGSLWFDWVVNGNTTWHPEEVSGPGTVWGGLAMTHSYGGVQIAAQGPRGSLLFFWAADGTSTWHPEQIAGPGTMQGAPAMVAGNNTEEIAVRATDNSLRYYWSYDGTPTWYQGQIAPPGYASTDPSMTRSSGGTEIAVAGP